MILMKSGQPVSQSKLLKTKLMRSIRVIEKGELSDIEVKLNATYDTTQSIVTNKIAILKNLHPSHTALFNERTEG